MTDATAMMDQWKAQHRDYAEWCLGIMDGYIRVGFTRKEAFQLTLQYLDWLMDHAPD